MIVSNHGALMEALVGLLDGAGAEPGQRAAGAVQLTKEAVDATPPEHSEHVVRLLNFVVASATLARLDHGPGILETLCRSNTRLSG